MLKVAFKVAKKAAKKVPKIKKVASVLVVVGEGCLIMAPAFESIKAKKARKHNAIQN